MNNMDNLLHLSFKRKSEIKDSSPKRVIVSISTLSSPYNIEFVHFIYLGNAIASNIEKINQKLYSWIGDHKIHFNPKPIIYLPLDKNEVVDLFNSYPGGDDGIILNVPNEFNLIFNRGSIGRRVVGVRSIEVIIEDIYKYEETIEYIVK